MRAGPVLNTALEPYILQTGLRRLFDDVDTDFGNLILYKASPQGYHTSDVILLGRVRSELPPASLDDLRARELPQQSTRDAESSL